MITQSTGTGANEGGAVIDKARVELYQTGAEFYLLHSIFRGENATHADDRNTAVQLLGKGLEGLVGAVVERSAGETALPGGTGMILYSLSGGSGIGADETIQLAILEDVGEFANLLLAHIRRYLHNDGHILTCFLREIGLFALEGGQQIRRSLRLCQLTFGQEKLIAT